MLESRTVKMKEMQLYVLVRVKVHRKAAAGNEVKIQRGPGPAQIPGEGAGWK